MGLAIKQPGGLFDGEAGRSLSDDAEKAELIVTHLVSGLNVLSRVTFCRIVLTGDVGEMGPDSEASTMTNVVGRGARHVQAEPVKIRRLGWRRSGTEPAMKRQPRRSLRLFESSQVLPKREPICSFLRGAVGCALRAGTSLCRTFLSR